MDYEFEISRFSDELTRDIGAFLRGDIRVQNVTSLQGIINALCAHEKSLITRAKDELLVRGDQVMFYQDPLLTLSMTLTDRLTELIEETFLKVHELEL